MPVPVCFSRLFFEYPINNAHQTLSPEAAICKRFAFFVQMLD
jgi:hypothetical protein